MNFNSELIIRIVRGSIGFILIITGVLYGNLIGFFGAFLLLGAISGGCGIGSSGCSIKNDEK